MRRRTRKGNAILSALTLTTLAGFAALVIDMGYARMVHYQLQAAADAAAHAAVPFLDYTAAGIDAAGASAVRVGAANRANGASVALVYDAASPTSGDIVPGEWAAGVFTPSTDPAVVNAVQVTARATGVRALFSRLAFGTESLSASASAVALKPPPGAPGAVECFLPIAIPLCALEGHTADTLADYDFQFSSSSVDNASWASLFNHPAASDITGLLSDCEAEGEAAVGETTYLNNGEITSGLNALATAIGNSSTTWDTSTLGTQPTQMTNSAIPVAQYGHTFEAPLLVFDQGAQSCTAINYVQSYPLAGFAWGVVYDVRSTGPNAHTIKMRVNNRVSMEFGTRGGGTIEAGVVYQPPAMVVY